MEGEQVKARREGQTDVAESVSRAESRFEASCDPAIRTHLRKTSARMFVLQRRLSGKAAHHIPPRLRCRISFLVEPRV